MMEDDERVSRGKLLIDWLVAEGGLVSCDIRTSLGGCGVFTSCHVTIGQELFRCPLTCLMRSSDALSDPIIGEVLRSHTPAFSSRELLMILLMRCRASPSRWAPYVDGLPGFDLAHTLPINWVDLELLQGTTLHAQVLRERSDVVSFEAVLSRLFESSTGGFPPGTFSSDALRWAHAVFWSRAIALDIPGTGREECLVPLLDHCNHRPGIGGEVVLWRERSNGQANTTGVSNTPRGWFSLRAVRPSEPDTEVFINYGAKGYA